MNIDLDLLAYLAGKGVRHLEESVAGTSYLPRTVRGVGLFLLDRDGNLGVLTAKQQVTYEKFLKPLLFDVPCRGETGPESCRGNGLIEPDLLLQGFREDDLRCRACRTPRVELSTKKEG